MKQGVTVILFPLSMLPPLVQKYLNLNYLPSIHQLIPCPGYVDTKQLSLCEEEVKQKTAALQETAKQLATLQKQQSIIQRQLTTLQKQMKPSSPSTYLKSTIQKINEALHLKKEYVFNSDLNSTNNIHKWIKTAEIQLKEMDTLLTTAQALDTKYASHTIGNHEFGTLIEKLLQSQHTYRLLEKLHYVFSHHLCLPNKGTELQQKQCKQLNKKLAKKVEEDMALKTLMGKLFYLAQRQQKISKGLYWPMIWPENRKCPK